jgi:glutamate--cysteine ligase
VTRRELLEWFQGSCRAPSDRRVGLVWQVPAVRRDGRPVGFSEPSGLTELINGLAERHDWVPDRRELLQLGRDGSRVALGLGGQIELTTCARLTLAEVESEARRHLAELQDVTRGADVLFLQTGFTPLARAASLPALPLPRLAALDRWLAPRSERSSELLKGGCVAVVGLDYTSEEDCRRKLAVATSLAPVVTALGAASPLADGRPTGSRSWRARCWQTTDAERTAPFDPARFTFAGWIAELLRLPLTRAGIPFVQWLTEGRQGRYPGLSDFFDHLRTMLPTVRVTDRLEIRCADNGPLPHVLGLAALWKGLLLDDEALTQAEGVASAIRLADLPALTDLAAGRGLGARWAGRSLRAWSGLLLEIAAAGLSRQPPDGPAEVAYLAPLIEAARAGEEPAVAILGAWEETPDPQAFLARIAYPSVGDIPLVAPSAGAWGTAELRAVRPD